MTLPGFVPRPSQDNTDEIVKLWRTVRAMQKTSGNSGALGYIGSSTNLLPGTITTAEVMHSESVTFNATAGRVYEMVYTLNLAVATGAPILTGVFRVANSTTVGVSDTFIRSFVNSDLTGAFTTTTRQCFWLATFTGTCTIGMSTFTNAGGTVTIDATRERDLLIKDIGT